MILNKTDYEKIYSIIKGIYTAEVSNDLNGSCVFFNLLGMFILEEHYGFDVEFKIGGAAYKIDDSKNIGVLYGELKNNKFNCTEDFYHAWLQVNNKWFIDFTAPHFHKNIRMSQDKQPIERLSFIPPKMMQKELRLDKQTIDEVINEGDFFLLHDDKLRQTVLNKTPYVSDPTKINFWAGIANSWYNKNHHEIAGTAIINKANGQTKNLIFKDTILNGAW